MSVSRIWLLSIAVACQQASAQVAPLSAPSAGVAEPDAATERLVDELVANAARDRAMLPSLTAHESIISKVDEHVWVGKNTVKAEANVRIVRKPSEEGWAESREFTVVNGKPVAPNANVSLPFDIANSFDDHQDDFFSDKNRPCYNFSLAARTGQDAPLELTITPLPAAGTSSHCVNRSGMVRLDPATHRLVHLEFAYAPNANISQWAVSVDYAATQVGDKVFNLPSVVGSRIVFGKTPKEWTAHYSDYHQYAASSTILPAQ